MTLVPARDFQLPSRPEVQSKLEAVRQFQGLVQQTLIKGHDFGVIPGTSKPTLLKPGAEKIAKLLACADTYDILSKTEDWDKPLFSYEIKCTLTWMETGVVVSEGLGEANSHEPKYRYRQGQGGGTIINEDVAGQKNTLLKMAKKRALVDAALSAGRLSDVFTQDIEEFQSNNVPMSSPRDDSAEQSYWCDDHELQWFRRGKMRSYAHPIGDTGEWCNMPDAAVAEPPIKPAPDPSPSPAPEEASSSLVAEPPDLPDRLTEVTFLTHASRQGWSGLQINGWLGMSADQYLKINKSKTYRDVAILCYQMSRE
jgi:hypothetical protein